MKREREKLISNLDLELGATITIYLLLPLSKGYAKRARKWGMAPPPGPYKPMVLVLAVH